MEALKHSISHIRVLGGITFVEAIRQKLFNFMALLCLSMVGGAHFFRSFDFGDDTWRSELKFIADFGFGAILFFGMILSIVVTAQLFFSEIENRTALTVLAKPINKLSFVFGKFSGVYSVLLIFTAITTILLAGLIYWRETALLPTLEKPAGHGEVILYGNIFVYGFIQCLKFGILCAVTILVASFATTYLYTVTVSFIVMVICQLQYLAQSAWSDVLMVKLLGYLFPNFQVFNVNDILASNEPLAWMMIGRIILFGVSYIAVYILLAVYSFNNREI